MHSLALLALAPCFGGVSAAPNWSHWPHRPDAHHSGKTLPVVREAKCDDVDYINRGLVAYGTVASDARDKLGDTLGGFGSAIAPDVKSFGLDRDGTVSGTLYAVPDRGWNTEGSIDFQGRVQKFQLNFKPTFKSIKNGTENLDMKLKDTTLLWKSKTRTTGLDAEEIIKASRGFPDLPAAKRPNGELAPSLDLEGFVRLRDGSYWISDEYGPYIYHFTKDGDMVTAIEPPASFLPYANGQKTFTSGNPPVGSDEKAADDPDTGRANNHGFEGLAISPDERYLTVQIQASLMEDGGSHGTRSNNTRQLTYDLRDRHEPRLVSEYIVQQPGVDDPTEDKNPRSTDVSELHWLAENQFLILARDSGHGRGSGDDHPSVYRHIDVTSNRGATNIRDQDAGPGTVAIAPEGYLLPDVVAEKYCEFIDINNSTELARFGLHNGGPFEGELNEKWESLAVIPVPKGADGYGEQEFYIISVSDNDFITQNGYYGFGKTKYKDASGLNVDTQILVWQAHLPQYVAHN